MPRRNRKAQQRRNEKKRKNSVKARVRRSEEKTHDMTHHDVRRKEVRSMRMGGGADGGREEVEKGTDLQTGE